MFDDSNEESEFWSRVPDSRLDRFRRTRSSGAAPADRPASRRPSPAHPAARPRTAATPRPAGSRSHGDPTGAIPVVPAARVRREAPVDPLLKRLGALAVVTAVLVPVALYLRADHTPGVTPAEAAAESTLAVAGADSSAAGTDSSNPWAGIDVNALPPAVPVNTDAATTQAAAPAVEAAPATAGTAAATTPTVARAQAKVSTASSCPKKYTVRSGDAWILIAQRAKVTVKSLLAVNNATSATPLYPGRSICLPANAVRPATVTPTSTKPVVKAPTTTAPKVTTTTAPKPPTRTYTRAQVIQIIRDVWPDNLEDKAIAIATRESNLNPSVRNYCCYGLFQIYYKVHKGWLALIGITSSSQLYDPRTNAYAAYVMYQRSGGWGPWGG